MFMKFISSYYANFVKQKVIFLFFKEIANISLSDFGFYSFIMLFLDIFRRAVILSFLI